MAELRARRRLPIAPDGGAAPSRRAQAAELPPVPADFVPDVLRDADARSIRYLRLSVTDRCDMACVYCMPPGGEDEHGLRAELLSFEEIARLVRVVAPLGVRRVRLTGGEPLVRRDVVRLVAQVRAAGVDDVWMTTNASRLAQLARPLAEAGLSGVNVSLDSLEAQRFARITRGGELASVLSGLAAAREAGLAIRTNAVVLRGENDTELPALARFAWSLGATPRFIEVMPIGEGALLDPSLFVPASEMRQLLAPLELTDGAWRADDGRGPARYLVSRDDPSRRVGFITAVSDEFCASCNRFRVTALGEVRACLASRRAVSLRDVMRAGAGDRELAWAVAWALAGKDPGHVFSHGDRAGEHAHVGMSLIGG